MSTKQLPAKPETVNGFELLRGIDRGIFGSLTEELRKKENALQDLNRQMEVVDRERAFVLAKIQKLHASTMGNPGLLQALQAQPHDAGLVELLKKGKGGWDKLKKEGADDARILMQLKVSWPHYDSDPYRTNRATGGDEPSVWINSPGYGVKPTFAGQALAREVRRVLAIPQIAAKPKPPAPTKPPAKKPEKSGGGSNKPKASAKPPQAPKAAAPAKVEARDAVAGFVEKFPKKPPAKTAKPSVKPKAAEPADDGYGKWLAAVNAHGLNIREGQGDLKWRELFTGGSTPAQAVETLRPDVDQTSLLESGQTYTAAEAGFAHDQLEAAMSPGLHPHDGAGGQIGWPLHDADAGNWAVVSAAHSTGEILYTLVPCYLPKGWEFLTSGKSETQTWAQRRKAHPKCAPEDVPIDGLLVTNPDGDEWVLDKIENAAFVKVPVEPKTAAAAPAPDAGQDSAEEFDDAPPAASAPKAKRPIAAHVRTEFHALMDDESVNENGIYVRAKWIDLGLREPDRAKIAVARGNDGKYRADFQWDVGVSSSGSLPAVSHPAHATEELAVQSAAKSMLAGLQSRATSASSKAEKSKFTAAANMVRGCLERLEETSVVKPSEPQDWVARMEACKTADEAREVMSEHEQAIASLQRSMRLIPSCGQVDAISYVGFSAVGKKEWQRQMGLAKAMDPSGGAELDRLVREGTQIHAGKKWAELLRAEDAKGFGEADAGAAEDFDDEAIDKATEEILVNNPGRVAVSVARRRSGRWAYSCDAHVAKLEITRDFTGSYASREEAGQAAADVVDDFAQDALRNQCKDKSGPIAKLVRRQQAEEIRREMDRLDKKLQPPAPAMIPADANLASPYRVGRRVRISSMPGEYGAIGEVTVASGVVQVVSVCLDAKPGKSHQIIHCPTREVIFVADNLFSGEPMRIEEPKGKPNGAATNLDAAIPPARRVGGGQPIHA